MLKAAGQFEGGEHGKTGRDRRHFLEAAQMEVPALAANLANVFVAASPGVDLRGTWWWLDFIGVPGVMLTEDGAPFAALKCGVETWAGTFHLTKDGAPPEWILEGVAATFSRYARAGKPDGVITAPGYSEMLPDIDYSLYRRHEPGMKPETEFHPDVDKSRYWHLAGGKDYRSIEESRPITTWNPFFGKSKKEMVAAIKSEYNLKIESLERIEKEAKHFGFIKAPTNFNPDHFRWAAKYQVGALDVDLLAKRLGLKKRILWSAISTTLASVGLTQRASRRGRPPVI